jgi:hypothetical protein
MLHFSTKLVFCFLIVDIADVVDATNGVDVARLSTFLQPTLGTASPNDTLLSPLSPFPLFPPPHTYNPHSPAVTNPFHS